MKATITKEGKLKIWGEDSVECYALKMWVKENVGQLETYSNEDDEGKKENLVINKELLSFGGNLKWTQNN